MQIQEVQAAATLLGCRDGASPQEVRHAYRLALQRVRTPTGAVARDDIARLRDARDLLLSRAPADRRRRPRTATGGSYLPLRRSTWGLGDEQPPSVVAQL